MFKSLRRNLTNWKTVLMSVAIILVLQGTSMAVPITWTGGTGNWNNSSNWSPIGLPNGTSDVLIDNFPGGPSSVTLDISTTISSLTVDALDSLNFNNSRDLTIATGGAVNNAGTINMNGTTSATDFTFRGGSSLNGTGSVVMGNSTLNRILTDATTLTQAAGHTIRGS